MPSETKVFRIPVRWVPEGEFEMYGIRWGEFKPVTPEQFVEMDRRIKEKHEPLDVTPDLFVEAKDADK